MILLDIRLSRIEERCTLMHEIVHAERGPFSLWLIAGEEAAVDVETALWFSPDALGMLSLGRCIPRSPLWRFSRNPRSHLAQDLRRTPGGPGVLLTRRRSPALQADSSPKMPDDGAHQACRATFFAPPPWRVACFRGA